MSFTDSFGDRMKTYERTSQLHLMRRTPVIIRLDGISFHTYTRAFSRPFDTILHEAMLKATAALVAGIQGCVLGYTQSDEISLLVRDWDTLQTDAWYGYNLQKLVSASAAICTYAFNQAISKAVANGDIVVNTPALFDSRAYNLPKEEVCNYFIWRQSDASRNSINSLAQSMFSHSSLQNLKISAVHDKLMLEKQVNWNDLDTWKKRGSAVWRREDIGVIVDREIPIFTQDREYVDDHIYLSSIETEDSQNAA